MTLTLISYNTQYCTGLDGITDPKRIAREIGHGDIIALQEIDRHWARTDHADQAEALSAALPDRYWVFGAGYDMDASTALDGRVINRRRQFGNMILSRWPILMSRNHLLPKLHLSGPMSLQRSALETVIETPIGPLRIFSVHLAHAAASERRLQIKRLLEVVDQGRRDGGAWSGAHINPGWADDGPTVAIPRATVLLGDFNLVPSSKEYEMLAGEVDPVFGPLTQEDQFADTWQLAGTGPGTTFEDQHGARRLDFAFCSSDLRASIASVSVITDASGSDHLPVQMRITDIGQVVPGCFGRP